MTLEIEISPDEESAARHLAHYVLRALRGQRACVGIEVMAIIADRIAGELATEVPDDVHIDGRVVCEIAANRAMDWRAIVALPDEGLPTIGDRRGEKKQASSRGGDEKA